MIKPFLPSERSFGPKNTFGRTMIRSGMVMALSKGGDSAAVIAEEKFPDDPETVDYFKRGAVVSLATTTSGAPTSTTLDVLVPILGPASAMGNLIKLTPKHDFGEASTLQTPTIVASGAGLAFIAEGSPFPLRQLSLSPALMTPKKMGFGIAITRELYEHSSAEAFLSPVFARNLSLGMETILFDANTETTTRPAGLKAGISATTADAGSGETAMVNDLANLAAVVAAVSATNFCYIMSPKQYVKFLLRKPSDFNIPTFCSSALPDRQVCCLGLDAFMIAGSGTPRFEISKKATVVMADDAGPVSIVATPNTVAASISSAFQQDLVLTRLIANIDWQLRHSSGFSWTEAVNW